MNRDVRDAFGDIREFTTVPFNSAMNLHVAVWHITRMLSSHIVTHVGIMSQRRSRFERLWVGRFHCKGVSRSN